MGIFKLIAKLYTGLWNVFLFIQKWLGMLTLGLGWIMPYFLLYSTEGSPALVAYCIMLTIAIRDLYVQRKARKAKENMVVEPDTQLSQ